MAILPAVRKSPSGEFELRPTFGKICIVIDRPEWSEDGVLVVCRYEETAGALGLGMDAADSRQIGWMPMTLVRPVFSAPAPWELLLCRMTKGAWDDVMKVSSTRNILAMKTSRVGLVG